MKLSLLMGAVAICISVVAAYYSIAGLAAIFSGAVIPIIIMGIVLEIGKVAGVVWLHYNWDRAPTLIKAYLVPALVILMLITSMGIFGFLSKAHIEQTSAATESSALVLKINTEIDRQNNLILRSDRKIKELDSSEDNDNTAIQIQIDKEQARIDTAYDRSKPAIDEQKEIISSKIELYSDQVAIIDSQFAKLQEYLDNNEVDKVQRLVGEKSPGGWGPKTAKTVNTWKADKTSSRGALITKIENISNSKSVINARKEIKRIRNITEAHIGQSNIVIERLRSKLGKSKLSNLNDLIDVQHNNIKKSTDEIELLTAKKYELESEYRKLEADVGPIKYIAEFIYGDTDQNILDKAVRIVIIVIVLVFDPLAIILILAASLGFKWAKDHKSEDKDKSEDKSEDKICRLEEEIHELHYKYDDELNDLKHDIDKQIAIITEQSTEIEKLRDIEKADVMLADDSDIVIERDKLQAELDQVGIDLEVVQQEISKVPVLETAVQFEKQKVQVLEQKIIELNAKPINTEQADIKLLQKTNEMLKTKIASMMRITDFSMDDAQELIEAKTMIVDLTKELGRLKNGNQ